MTKLRALFLVLFLSTLCFGADITEKYTPDGSTGALDAISVVDTADLTILPDRVVPTAQNKNVTVNASFGTAASTASIGIIRGTMNDGTFVASDSVDWATFTADAAYLVNGRYVSKSVTFDTAGYPACRIFIKAISAGTVKASWKVH